MLTHKDNFLPSFAISPRKGQKNPPDGSGGQDAANAQRSFRVYFFLISMGDMPMMLLKVREK